MTPGPVGDPFGEARPLLTGYYRVHPVAGELKPGAQQLKAWLTDSIDLANEPSGSGASIKQS